MTQYKVWCIDCDEWVDNVEIGEEWIYCSKCGLGLIQVIT